jgi:hypothetical protein
MKKKKKKKKMYCFSKRLIERNKNDKNIKNTYMEKVFLKIAFTKEGNSRGSDKSRQQE